ncbi:sialic acid-binding Ig-like lectin 7 [Astatotilapia calliptera]|uniref:Ig-like domain-containing protein n=1 Tax=Astatotilapia calliptera TaxID=8154 RepID=A0AAX7TQK5_ASTCA|nr:sialic acid-binding Ig-like lectin 7 [Astatotilapia calliptera]
MSFVTVQSVNIMTGIMLLSLLFIPKPSTACPEYSDLFITAPTEMEALSGSCLQIPCSFSAAGPVKFDIRRAVFGVWIKNHSNVNKFPNNEIFNSSGTVNIYPMKITGNLKEKNCTTLFSNLTTTYTNTYYFRIMNWPFRATAVCEPLKIKIKDSPWRPNITIPGDLKEKESVTITCSALTPCPHSPPQLTWNLQQDSHSKIEENTDGSFTTKIQQNITLSDTHDGKKISCSARYPVNQGKDTKTAETEETLSVSYAPKDTSASISPSGLVSAGSWVNLTCSSRAKPPVSSFTWFKKSRDGAVKVSEGEIYSFNVTDGGVYYCVATNDLGNQTSAEINVTVAGHQNNGSLPLSPLLGGILGLVLLICLIIFAFRALRLLKYQTQQETQSQRSEELVVEEPTSKTEGGEGNIHYGEINFSEPGYEASFVSVQDRGQQQDTVYAQVKVNKPENSLTQRAHGQEELYAEVRISENSCVKTLHYQSPLTKKHRNQ